MQPVVLSRPARLEHALDARPGSLRLFVVRLKDGDAAVLLARAREEARALEGLGAAQHCLLDGARWTRDTIAEEGDHVRRVAAGRDEGANSHAGDRAVERENEPQSGVVGRVEAVRVGLDREQVLLFGKVAVAERLVVGRGGARFDRRRRSPPHRPRERVLWRQEVIVGGRFNADDEFGRVARLSLVRRLPDDEHGALREEGVEVGPIRHAMQVEVVEREVFAGRRASTCQLQVGERQRSDGGNAHATVLVLDDHRHA